MHKNKNKTNQTKTFETADFTVCHIQKSITLFKKNVQNYPYSRFHLNVQYFDHTSSDTDHLFGLKTFKHEVANTNLFNFNIIGLKINSL